MNDRRPVLILAFVAAASMNAQDIDTWMKELSNWGRWGAKDHWAP